jgi:hypothetical protein
LSRLGEITDRLREISAELGNPELDDDRAAQLTKEAAELAAAASEEVNRALQASADE